MTIDRVNCFKEDHYARPSRYRNGYREDEDICVDDQNCNNCIYGKSLCCPMSLEYVENAAEIKRIKKSRKENAVLHDSEPVWCIFWKERRREREYHEENT